jgi:phosphatidylserine decarboxylase
MTVHKEGTPTILIALAFSAAVSYAGFHFLGEHLVWLAWIISILAFGFFVFIVSFFRIPARTHTVDASAIVAPADGKVVVIEEMHDVEYFKDRRLQVSIFMSPLNVHVNRNPIDGEVLYSKYHPGKYLVAWDPKSSTDNERHSVVLRNGKVTILVKQIAGALARRIVNYLSAGEKVKQTEEFGFIKFGSRVDILLPPGTKVNVRIGEIVQGGVTVIATV